MDSHLRSNMQLDDQARVAKYGPVPNNPFVTLRSVNNTSLVQLSQLARIDRKALARVEKGMYANPLPSLVDYYVNLGRATEGDLITRYEDFQFEQRRRHTQFFGSILHVTNDGTHPFRQLRSGRPSLHDPEILIPVGITEVCERLCLPLDTIQFFEKKWRLQQSVPKLLKSVLSQIGYTRTDINQFEAKYIKWRNENKSVNRVGD